jgi:hypothetical protein
MKSLWPGIAAVVLVAACRPNFDLVDREDIFAEPGDHGVTCAADMEWPHIDEGVIDLALERASRDHIVVQLFGHDPGVTVPMNKIEMVLDDANARGLQWLTYRELAEGVPRVPGIAYSFDDNYIEHWAQLRPLLARYHARVTFFISKYDQLTPAQRQLVRDLASDGHDIEYHSTHHEDAATYSRVHGIDAYLAYDIDPALAEMRADGWNPIAFAYPSGHRTSETDRALLDREHFQLLRSVMRECPQSHHEHVEAEQAQLDVTELEDAENVPE